MAAGVRARQCNNALKVALSFHQMFHLIKPVVVLANNTAVQFSFEISLEEDYRGLL